MGHPLARLRPAAALSLLLMLCAVPAAAQFDVPQRVVASGGANMGSTNFSVQGTMGQPGIGPLNGDNTSVLTGYWYLWDVIATAIGDTAGLPRAFSIDQNFPNPFNPTTTIRFALPRDSFVSLHVFDVSGRLVAELVNETRPAGVYSETFDASSLASGVYLYRIEADRFVQSRKFVLMK